MINQLTIGQGQSVILTPQQLFATHNGVADPDLRFIIANITHGSLSSINFTQQAITHGDVLIMTDDGVEPPGYWVTVTDGRTTTNSTAANVTFYKQPIFNANQLFVKVGGTVTLTTDNLCVNECDDVVSDNIQFNVDSPLLQYGQFEQVGSPGKSIMSFLQREIKSNGICFVADGGGQAPRYSLMAVDLTFGLSSNSTGSSLLLTQNYWPINQGQILNITPAVLNVTGSMGQDDKIIYTLVDSTLTEGYFALAQTPQYAISSFKQSQVINHQVVFVPDGTAIAPTAVLTVSDGQSLGAHGSLSCNIDFAAAPVLQHAFLKISPPDNFRLSQDNLQASDARTPPGQLIFTVSDVANDHFANTNDWAQPILNFSQQEVMDGQIYFIAKTNQPPAFAVSVFNGRLSCLACPKEADVIAPADQPNDQTKIFETLFSLVMSVLLIPVLRYGVEKAIKEYLSLRKNTVDSQLTAAILNRLWIGACGVITRARYDEYIVSVGDLVNTLAQLGDAEEDKEIPLRENWGLYSDNQKEKIKKTIAEGAEQVLTDNTNSCYRFFRSLCRPEATPKELYAQRLSIAMSVRRRLLLICEPARRQRFEMMDSDQIVQSDSMGDSKSTPLLRDP